MMSLARLSSSEKLRRSSTCGDLKHFLIFLIPWFGPYVIPPESMSILRLTFLYPAAGHIGIDTQAQGRFCTSVALINYKAHCIQVEFF
jgi:hypothetical protein